MAIYTHDEAARIVEMFEKVLDGYVLFVNPDGTPIIVAPIYVLLMEQ